MSTEAEIRRRWRHKLNIRKRLAESAAQKLKLREKQIAHAERVLERHKPKVEPLKPITTVVYRTANSGPRPYGALGPIVRCTVHHTAGPQPATYEQAVALIRGYDRQHLEQYGGGIGYHEMIDPAGRLFVVRDKLAKGAHTRLENAGNYGLNLLGNFETSEPTPAALKTLRRRLTEAPPKGLPDLRRVEVRGHQEWPGQATACPGRNLLPEVRAIRAARRAA